MKGIKNYFKPASKIVAKETNVETNIIAKETNTEQSQSSIAKGTSLVAEKPCQPSSSFSFPKTAFGIKTVLVNLDGLPNSAGWIMMK